MKTPHWKRLTSTVGLVSARYGDGANVMAAEWTYLVNKNPLYFAVTLHRSCLTGDLIEGAGEFGVTLCSEAQASIAQFVGSFSGREIDKSAVLGLDWREPVSTKTPWVAGGVMAGECLVRQRVDLPEYRMFIGEAVSLHLPEQVDTSPQAAPKPLVKHDRMLALGERLPQRLVAVCQVTSRKPLTLRLAGTGPWSAGDPTWRVTLTCGNGRMVELGTLHSNEYGDLLTDVVLPQDVTLSDLSEARITVARGEDPDNLTEPLPITVRGVM